MILVAKVHSSDWHSLKESMKAIRLGRSKDSGRDTTEIKHVDAVLKLLSVMTGDARYANLLTNPNVKKGVHNMCDVAERLENKGRAEGQKAIIQNMLADHVPHDKIKQYTHATDAEIAEAEEEMLVK